ncbi:MAG: hypothetical protein ACE37M_07880 [Henriciella sp.]
MSKYNKSQNDQLIDRELEEIAAIEEKLKSILSETPRRTLPKPGSDGYSHSDEKTPRIKNKDPIRGALDAFERDRDRSPPALSPNQFEFHLDEAADLLDRVLANRGTYDALAASSYEQRVRVNHAAARIKTINSELKNKMYEDEYRRLYKIWEAEKSATASIKNQISRLKNYKKKYLTLRMKWDHEAAIAEPANMGGWPLYYLKLNGRKLAEAAIFNRKKGRFSSTEIDAKDYLTRTGEQRAWRTWMDWVVQHKSSLANLVEALDTQNKRLDQAFTAADDAHRKGQATKDNLIAERARNASIIEGSTSGSKPLHYEKRLLGLEKRIHFDFGEAIERMKSARTGMLSMLDEVDKLPTNKENDVFYDNCLLWVRQHISRVNSFLQKDKEARVPISLRALIPEEFPVSNRKIWWPEIDETHFSGMKNLRIRAVTAFVVSEESSSGPFQIRLTHSPNDPNSPGAILLPNITLNSSRESVELLGAKTLRNLNPMVEWKVELLGYVSDQPDTQSMPNVHDVVLEIVLAYQD